MIDSTSLSKPNTFLRIIGDLPSIKLNLSTDTRKLTHGEVFLALVGENFNGAEYVKTALELGACGIILEGSNNGGDEIILSLKKEYPQAFFIVVDNSLKYLQELAHLHIKSWKEFKGEKAWIIGITGSNGKTTTKEMLAHILRTLNLGEVYFTPGNFNNHIGVPLTLLAVEEIHNFVIVEMGTNHPGELEVLCKIAIPNSGIITNIGSSHLEFFHNEESVFVEKRTLFDFVMKNTSDKGPFIVKGNDPYLKKLITKNSSKNVVSYGDEHCQIKADLSVNQAVIHLSNDTIILKNENILGRHNFENLVATFLLADLLVPNMRAKIQEASSSFIPRNNRSTWIEEKGKKFFLDAYNANPSSMEAALESFVDFLNLEKVDLKNCLFILGDMNELGDSSLSFHEGIGAKLTKLNIDNALFVGRYSAAYQLGFKKKSKEFSSTKDLVLEWPQLKEKWDYFFIKGSRSLHLESLMEN